MSVRGEIPANLLPCSSGLKTSTPIRDRSLDKSTLLETMALLTLVILLIRTAAVPSGQWWLAPAVLLAAAVLPSQIRRTQLPPIGLARRQITSTLQILAPTCIITFGALFCGLWILSTIGLSFPLRPIIPQNQHLLSWVLYQMLYVGVAEEVFFRGYLQTNLQKLLKPAISWSPRKRQWITIILSAACFALAHVAIQGRIVSIVTFLPGLVLAWLFVRTKSLLAPVLFHGLANCCYLMIAGIF